MEDKGAMSVHFLTVGITAITFAASCESASLGISVGPEPTAIMLAVSELVLEVGETRELLAEIQDDQGSPMAGIAIDWQSEDPDVALVDNAGRVDGMSPGHTA